ncbi:TAXI family TRAP transporter solute-binding subunit [Bacillus sp. FJAT-29814]|uniref:TAXI family TRAP transporter solute-binding subunit n=1 Tax=Bacillus sp. FJAT-29814 TaxID=1729688 RepID=UPI00082EBA8B|nr:TAXI family TRAP transporter solute-binding subunit [Bacillus sp. FJAT-29814]
MGIRKIGKSAFSLLTIVLVMLFVTACGGNQANNSTQEKEKPAKKSGGVLSIGTTPVGVSYNAIGNGLAKVITTNSSLKISVKPSNGVSAWGPQLEKGEIELGVGSGPDMAWAFKGENGYQPTKNMRLLVRGNYLSVTGAVVRKDVDIKSIADLKGKRLSSDYPGSAIAKKVLEAALTVNGLSWDDVKQVPIPTTAAGIEALQDNRVDAAFALTPTTPVVQEVHNSVGLKSINFLDSITPDKIDSVPKSVIDKINEIVPGVRLTKVLAQGYIQEEQVGIEYPSQLVASSHLNDDTVYEIMETLWANYKQLQPIHAWLKTWTPETMFDPNPTVPYHNGAVKFFKDKGLWNDEAEKVQQELLKIAES